MSQKLVYLDHNATTPVAAEIRGQLSTWAEAWGNPSSVHAASRAPKQILRESRRDLSAMLNISPLELIFTSGGSESNATVMKSVWTHRESTRNKILISSVEHPSLIRSAEALVDRGAVVVRIPVNRQGQLDLDFLNSHLDASTLLVSVMAANNETGTLFPVKEIAKRAHAAGAFMHSDAVQMLGKLTVDLQDWDVDYASFSAHKFYALKGTGLLFVKKGKPHEPVVYGAQERHRRGGTENILGIAAFGWTATRASSVVSHSEKVATLRDHFECRVLEEIPGVTLTAAESPRLPNTSSLLIPGTDGETLLMGLDLKGFAVSTGAACSSGSPEPSPVLLAIGLSEAEAQSSLRVSLGWENTLEEVDAFVEVLKQVVFRLRSFSQNPEVTHGTT